MSEISCSLVKFNEMFFTANEADLHLKMKKIFFLIEMSCNL